jgi:8-oxo-dGTP diphosphatase
MEIQRHTSVLRVAVGVVCNDVGEVLIARRAAKAHQGGLWEFPGGKVEQGETVEDALRRELREELSIVVDAARPLIKIAHDYGDKQVLLDVWRVEAFNGEPQGLEGQPIRWAAVEELPKLAFPAANRPIIAAARLPSYYPIVDDGMGNENFLFEQLDRLSRSGYRLAQWRVKTLQGSVYMKLAKKAVAFARLRGLALVLNSEPEQTTEVGAAGVHLTGPRLWALRRRPLPERLWVASSCHTLEDIRQAESIGADFIVLSPVLPTLSHPGIPPLGWEQFGIWAETARLPVFALGGLNRSHLAQANRHGAQGVAGIRGFL